MIFTLCLTLKLWVPLFFPDSYAFPVLYVPILNTVNYLSYLSYVQSTVISPRVIFQKFHISLVLCVKLPIDSTATELQLRGSKQCVLQTCTHVTPQYQHLLFRFSKQHHSSATLLIMCQFRTTMNLSVQSYGSTVGNNCFITAFLFDVVHVP